MYCASLRKMRALCGLRATQRTALRMQSWIASTGPDELAAIDSKRLGLSAGPSPMISLTISSFEVKWW